MAHRVLVLNPETSLARLVPHRTSVHRSPCRNATLKRAPVLDSESKFSKVLVANRGEIACRVMRTCRDMGIRTVAVHSDVDSKAVHVRMADEAICIGPAPTLQSYLNMDAILAAVRQTGAEAVHPGYGFLSENVKFADKLQENGVTFIGPPHRAIEGMGDKIRSKKLAKEAGVNVIPGFDGAVTSVEECLRVANDIGYPVMIKATAGGGGKGMRIAWNDKEAKDGYRFAKDEAASSFGNDEVFVERFIDNPRHIEIQILADGHGNAIYLNERECSIQRRNQKVIEEAPSPFIDAATRKQMGEQAVALAKHVGYSTAGTVEFLVDSKRNFFFLEMNTRLQVEHPITECITGIDIVQQMLRVAKGHHLNISQEDVPLRGWAIESRVYAEDPYKNFGLPSIGRLSRYIEPTHIPNVRCDSGVTEGSDISIYYDPMICKLITYGETRNEAIATQLQALDSYVIRGVTHNIPLLRDIFSEPRFLKGDINTHYLPSIYPEGFKGAQLSDADRQCVMSLAATVFLKHELRSRMVINENRVAPTRHTPHDIQLRISIGTSSNTITVVSVQDQTFKVIFDDGSYTTVDGKFTLATAVINTRVNDAPQVIQLIAVNPGQGCRIQYKGTIFDVKVLHQHVADLLPIMKEKPKIDYSKLVLSPMPGLVKSVACEEGQEVAEGQEVCVVEAMKMQNSLTVGAAGKVKRVNVKPGQTVEEGTVLVELE